MARNKFRYPAVLIFICLLLLTMTTKVYAQETLRVAKIAEFTGEVKIMKAGGEKVFPAFIGMGLTQGDRIITAKNANLTLEIDDNEKVVIIAENSDLIIDELVASIDSEEETSMFNLRSGGIWANIKNKLTSGSRFEIKTPTAVMGARSTKIYVSQVGGRTTYGVFEGSAYVASVVSIPEPDGSNRQVELILNQQQQIETDGAISDPAAVTVQEVTLQSLDLFVLEAIKELVATDPEAFDPDFLTQLNQIIEEKTEEQKQQEEKEQEEENPEPKIEYDSALQQDNSGGSGDRDDSPPPPSALTVSFDVDGGSVVESQSVNYNGKANEPVEPTKTGYTFGGWYTDNTFATAFDFANTAITGDTTIYAKWTSNLLPAVLLTADTTQNNVDNELEISFDYDADWVSSITSVKVRHSQLEGELELVKGEYNDYEIWLFEEDPPPASLTLYPYNGHPFLQKAGTLTLIVEADGYEVSEVDQVILPGMLDSEISSVEVDPVSPLAPGSTSMVTVTVVDLYNNPIQGHQLCLDIMMTNSVTTSGAIYIIDGVGYYDDDPDDVKYYDNIPLQNTTDENGTVEFQIVIPPVEELWCGEGFVVTVKSDGYGEYIRVGSSIIFDFLPEPD